MGGKSSRLSVEARLSLLGECGVDAGALPGRRRNSLLSGPAPEGPPGRTEVHYGGASRRFVLQPGRRSGCPRGAGAGLPRALLQQQESGQPPQAPQEDQAVRVPEAGQEAGPAPEAGQVVVASPGHEAGHAPEAGQVVAASPGHETCPAPEAGQVVAASLGHEVGPSPEAGQVVAASPGKEAGPAPEAGQVVAASPGKDSLGLWPGKARQGRGRAGSRLSHGLWDNLLAIAQTLSLTLVVYSALLEYFPD
ncbi:skin secretory protein xP2-like [Scylla paramamosain]|uniref:skin secretory protein xP2-like n=1 Tax=Scylla paramamosain TaxID=85552 RepID=UPI0030832D85